MQCTVSLPRKMVPMAQKFYFINDIFLRLNNVDILIPHRQSFQVSYKEQVFFFVTSKIPFTVLICLRQDVIKICVHLILCISDPVAEGYRTLQLNITNEFIQYAHSLAHTYVDIHVFIYMIRLLSPRQQRVIRANILHIDEAKEFGECPIAPIQ